MNLRRRQLLLLTVVALVVLESVACRRATSPGDLWFEPYVFETHDGQRINATLGRLVVPESRQKPGTGLIKLAFVRLPSTSPTPGAPIFYLSGGPGVSGIYHPQGRRSTVVLAMREIGDVILIDQRGVGMTEPRLDCGRLEYPLDQPATREGLLRVYRERASACAQKWKQRGINLAAYNTNENADDINALREALGLEKVSLLAASYGTTLAMTILRRHPGSVHRVIMMGMEGPDHTYKLPSNAQKQIEEIVRLSKTNPVIQKHLPDIPKLMVTLSERLKRQPVKVELASPATKEVSTVVLGDFDLRLMTAASIGHDPLLRTFPLQLMFMSKGDFSKLGRWAEAYRYEEISAMQAAMDCSSGSSPQRWNRIVHEEPGTTLGRDLDFPFPEVCDAWGIMPLDASFRSPLVSDVPTLFISGTLDVRTPVANAEEIRKGFPNSTLVIVEGAAHSDQLFISSPLIGKVMLEFMKGLPVSTEKIEAPFEFQTEPQINE